MTTIKHLLEMPIGQRWGGNTFTIKTAKKKWQVENDWWQQVILIDDTGNEIPADVRLGKLIPLNGKTQIHIIVAEIQNAEYLGKDRKKLVIHEYSLPSLTVDEYQSRKDEIDKEARLVVESKIRCWLVSSSIQGKDLSKAEILEWQNFIMTGE